METLLLHMPARFPLENVAYLDLSHLFSGRRFLYFCAEEVARQNGILFARHNYGPDHLLTSTIMNNY